jgi:hypothetical protein
VYIFRRKSDTPFHCHTVARRSAHKP